jgi:hypothetical protein
MGGWSDAPRAPPEPVRSAEIARDGSRRRTPSSKHQARPPHRMRRSMRRRQSTRQVRGIRVKSGSTTTPRLSRPRWAKRRTRPKTAEPATRDRPGTRVAQQAARSARARAAPEPSRATVGAGRPRRALRPATRSRTARRGAHRFCVRLIERLRRCRLRPWMGRLQRRRIRRLRGRPTGAVALRNVRHGVLGHELRVRKRRLRSGMRRG